MVNENKSTNKKRRNSGLITRSKLQKQERVVPIVNLNPEKPKTEESPEKVSAEEIKPKTVLQKTTTEKEIDQQAAENTDDKIENIEIEETTQENIEIDHEKETDEEAVHSIVDLPEQQWNDEQEMDPENIEIDKTEEKKKKKAVNNQKCILKMSEETKTDMDILLKMLSFKYRYEVLDLMIDSYVKNEFSNDQQRVFKELRKIFSLS